MALQGAEVADLHAAGPAVLGGRPTAHLARDHQLRARVTVQSQAFKLVQQQILPTRRLHRGNMALISDKLWAERHNYRAHL